MRETGMQENKPVISVIMPVYNGIKYVEAAINSVLAQTYKKFELILVDDGATDGSGYLCDVFAKRDDRVQVLHRKNGGISSARNLGLRCARGKYITLLIMTTVTSRIF